eukprot:scaffold63464_cov30-Tisochrysis_lutea.AAC.3
MEVVSTGGPAGGRWPAKHAVLFTSGSDARSPAAAASSHQAPNDIMTPSMIKVNHEPSGERMLCALTVVVEQLHGCIGPQVEGTRTSSGTCAQESGCSEATGVESPRAAMSAHRTSFGEPYMRKVRQPSLSVCCVPTTTTPRLPPASPHFDRSAARVTNTSIGSAPRCGDTPSARTRSACSASFASFARSPCRMVPAGFTAGLDGSNQLPHTSSVAACGKPAF